MLGYWWTVAGVVEGGAKRGHDLGFPTANVTLDPSQELKHGIYAVRVYLGGQRFHAAGYLGTRPTFDNGTPVLEVFLFSFEQDIYGREIEVEFIDYIRGDAIFDTPEALKTQMEADCAAVTAILSSLETDDPYSSFPLANRAIHT